MKKKHNEVPIDKAIENYIKDKEKVKVEKIADHIILNYCDNCIKNYLENNKICCLGHAIEIVLDESGWAQ